MRVAKSNEQEKLSITIQKNAQQFCKRKRKLTHNWLWKCADPSRAMFCLHTGKVIISWSTLQYLLSIPRWLWVTLTGSFWCWECTCLQIWINSIAKIKLIGGNCELIHQDNEIIRNTQSFPSNSDKHFYVPILVLANQLSVQFICNLQCL